MYCPSCGTENEDNNHRCTSCGTLLHGELYAQPQDSYSGVVPYRNGPALTSYYTGIFSFIPFLGLLIGPIAFVLGLKGLKVAREQPEAKGSVHAWVGIICGGLFGFGQWLLVLVAFLKR